MVTSIYTYDNDSICEEKDEEEEKEEKRKRRKIMSKSVGKQAETMN